MSSFFIVGLTMPIVSALRSAVQAAATSSGAVGLDGDGRHAEMLAVELQHQPGRVEPGGRLAGLDAADHVDRLGVVGHEDHVALPGVFVQAGGDAQGVLQ